MLAVGVLLALLGAWTWASLIHQGLSDVSLVEGVGASAIAGVGIAMVKVAVYHKTRGRDD